MSTKNGLFSGANSYLPEGIVIQNLEMNQLQYVPTIINIYYRFSSYIYIRCYDNLWHVYAIYQTKSHLEEVEGARPELGSARLGMCARASWIDIVYVKEIT